MRTLRRVLPLLILLVVAAAAWASGLTKELSWDSLARNQAVLAGWAGGRPVLAPALYISAYAAAVALSVPQAAVLTIAGGLLFGTVQGALCAIGGATIGSIAIFLLARSAFGEFLTHLSAANRGGRLLATVRDGLQRDGFMYLLAMRFLPIVPFWLVNLAASLGGVRLLPFAAATFIGIMPATFVFASIGAGVGDILAAGGRPDLSVVFSPRIFAPLIALALLSLLPIGWRKWRGADA